MSQKPQRFQAAPAPSSNLSSNPSHNSHYPPNNIDFDHHHNHHHNHHRLTQTMTLDASNSKYQNDQSHSPTFAQSFKNSHQQQYRTLDESELTSHLKSSSMPASTNQNQQRFVLPLKQLLQNPSQSLAFDSDQYQQSVSAHPTYIAQQQQLQFNNRTSTPQQYQQQQQYMSQLHMLANLSKTHSATSGSNSGAGGVSTSLEPGQRANRNTKKVQKNPKAAAVVEKIYNNAPPGLTGIQPILPSSTNQQRIYLAQPPIQQQLSTSLPPPSKKEKKKRSTQDVEGLRKQILNEGARGYSSSAHVSHQPVQQQHSEELRSVKKKLLNSGGQKQQQLFNRLEIPASNSAQDLRKQGSPNADQNSFNQANLNTIATNDRSSSSLSCQDDIQILPIPAVHLNTLMTQNINILPQQMHSNQSHTQPRTNNLSTNFSSTLNNQSNRFIPFAAQQQQQQTVVHQQQPTNVIYQTLLGGNVNKIMTANGASTLIDGTGQVSPKWKLGGGTQQQVNVKSTQGESSKFKKETNTSIHINSINISYNQVPQNPQSSSSASGGTSGISFIDRNEKQQVKKEKSKSTQQQQQQQIQMNNNGYIAVRGNNHQQNAAHSKQQQRFESIQYDQLPSAQLKQYLSGSHSCDPHFNTISYQIDDFLNAKNQSPNQSSSAKPKRRKIQIHTKTLQNALSQNSAESLDKSQNSFISTNSNARTPVSANSNCNGGIDNRITFGENVIAVSNEKQILNRIKECFNRFKQQQELITSSKPKLKDSYYPFSLMNFIFAFVALLVIAGNFYGALAFSKRQKYILAKSLSEKCYGVILDAGSSSTKLNIYSWTCRDFASLPHFNPKSELTTKISPGISSFESDFDDTNKSNNNGVSSIKAYLSTLLEKAKNAVPSLLWRETPLMFGATAGMRLLSESKQQAILAVTRQFMKESGFYWRNDDWARVITGQEEGAYLWIAANYLLGAIKNNTNISLNSIHTISTLDLGGASTQIAFFSSKTTQHPELNLNVTIPGNNDYSVYSVSYLGYGNDQARNAVLSIQAIEENNEIHSGCFNRGYSQTDPETKKQVIGTSNPVECIESIRKFLNSKDCNEDTCSINGTFQPRIPDDQEILAVSGFHSAVVGFGLTFNFTATELRGKASDFCNLSYEQLVKQYPDDQYLSTKCFLGLYASTLLIDGYKVGNRVILSPDSINGAEPAWALGFIFEEVANFKCDDAQPLSACSKFKQFSKLRDIDSIRFHP